MRLTAWRTAFVPPSAFAEAYGQGEQGFMEAHHTRAVHEILPGQTTRLADLALVCANCHRMIHARRPWLTMAELKALARPPDRSATDWQGAASKGDSTELFN